MNPQVVAGVRHALRVIAGRCAHHPGGAFLLPERVNRVVCSADFIAAPNLRIFAFEVNGPSEGGGEAL